MNTAEKIEVMKAYLYGKPIQLKMKLNNLWEDYSDILAPDWNWSCYDYRVKPEEEKPRLMSNTININGIEISRDIEEDIIMAIRDYMVYGTNDLRVEDTEDIKNYCLKMEHLQKVLDAIKEDCE